PARAIVIFGFATIEVEKNMNKPRANSTRMPKKIVSASSRRKPACVSLRRSGPISLGDRGTFSPIRLNSAINDCMRGLRSSASGVSINSSRRRSIAPALLGMNISASAPTSSDPNTNARTGRYIGTLHLDLHDLFDPHVPDELHDHGGDQHELAHALT